MRSQQIQLVKRPSGLPDAEHYRFVDVELPELGEGEVLVRNVALSVDPYMRPRMNDVRSYIPPFQLNQPMGGGAVGVVEESRVASLPVGSWVVHQAGWRDAAVLRESEARRIEPSVGPSSYHLGILGMPSFTAYVGLVRVTDFREGDSLFVSGAAGAVGGLAGQYAKLLGASRVVGSVGTTEKREHVVRNLGFDEAFCYRDGSVRDLLSAAMPDGFSVYFDNVGTDHLAAALESINEFGRIALCGTISTYNDADAPVIPGNMFRAVAKRLRLQGFIVSDHEDLRDEFEQAVGGWLSEGKLSYRESVTWGLGSMPQAFAGMLTGANIGKTIIRLAEDGAAQ